MTSRVSHTTINCLDAFALSEWWKPVLGYVDLDGDPNNPGDEECMILDPNGTHRLLFIEVDELQQPDGRVHLDLAPTDCRREEEIVRVLALGATEVADRRNADGTGWMVLADPEGNHFCILRSDEERQVGRAAVEAPPVPARPALATGVSANLSVADLHVARGFYADYLGLDVVGFDLGWVTHQQSADGRAHVQLVTRDATSPEDSVISVHVGGSVDDAYAEAQRRGYEIVHPLTDEPWGVRRFFVRDPDGNVVNIVSHRD